MPQATHAPAMQHLFHAPGGASFSVPATAYGAMQQPCRSVGMQMRGREVRKSRRLSGLATTRSSTDDARRLRHRLTDVLFSSPNRHA
jgi:hypothetical protein